jgi:hypothetical protein
VHFYLLSILLILILSAIAVDFQTYSRAFSDKNQSAGNLECSQPAAQQRSFMRIAERSRYQVRRLEFHGNVRTGDYRLRRSVLLNEGDLFTRKNLIRSLQRLSALKIIKPVRLSDVEIRLDNEYKLVDMVFCFHER